MTTRGYLLITATIFAMVAIAHCFRAVTRLPAHVGSVDIPVWVSWVATFVPGMLSAWGFSAARKR